MKIKIDSSIQHIIRYLIVFFVIVVSQFAFAHEVLSEPEASEIKSRYKIFTAEHEAVAKDGRSVKIQSIFKIDLLTGTVWRYRQGTDEKGKTYEEFFEVPNQ